MRTPTKRATPAPTAHDEQPRARLLGFVMLLLTLAAGYAVTQRDIVTPTVAIADDAEADDPRVEADEPRADAEESRPVVTVAEILTHVEAVATRHDVPARLVAAIIAVESEFNPGAVSRRGARGLMQLMPATAASLDVQDSFDMRANIEGGVRHLRILIERYHNDLPLVLAAYNAGDRAVIAYRGVPPFRETRRYVVRVLRRYDADAAEAAVQRIYNRKRAVVLGPPRIAALERAPTPDVGREERVVASERVREQRVVASERVREQRGVTAERPRPAARAAGFPPENP